MSPSLKGLDLEKAYFLVELFESNAMSSGQPPNPTPLDMTPTNRSLAFWNSASVTASIFSDWPTVTMKLNGPCDQASHFTLTALYLLSRRSTLALPVGRIPTFHFSAQGASAAMASQSSLRTNF